MIVSRWHRKYWFPLGRVIHFHDERFLQYRGTTCRITRHFTETGRLKFYCYIPRAAGSEHFIRTRRYSEIIQAVEQDITKDQACKSPTARSAKRSRGHTPCGSRGKTPPS